MLKGGLRGGTGEKNVSKLLERENMVKKQYKGSDVWDALEKIGAHCGCMRRKQQSGK